MSDEERLENFIDAWNELDEEIWGQLRLLSGDRSLKYVTPELTAYFDGMGDIRAKVTKLVRRHLREDVTDSTPIKHE